MGTIAVAFLFILVVSISPAAAQNPASICDSYARKAVEFQRQNLEANCGLTGPEWNDNYNYHYDWCVSGQNYRTVDRWTAWRDERIAQCRAASKSQAEQRPGEGGAEICEWYASRAVTHQRANLERSCGFAGPEWNDDYRYHHDWCISGNNSQLARRGDSFREQRLSECRTAKPPPTLEAPAQSVWVNRIGPITNDVLARVNRGIDELRSRSQQGRMQWLEYKPLDTQAIIAASKAITAAPNLASFERTYQSALNTATTDPKKMHLPPQIQSVLTVPEAGRVEPGTSLLITGENFGNQPGRVYLSYTVGRETPSTESRPEATVTETIALEPYRNSWAESWFSNLVIAKATTTYKDPFLAADRTGQLQLRLPDGSTATESITVGSGAPEIQSLQTVSRRDWIKPGEEFVIRGRNFGDSRGKVSLDLAQSEANRWQRVKGTTRYVFWPVAGPQPVGTTASVGLEIVDWNDRQVVLKAGDYSPQRYFGGTVATLVLDNKIGRRNFYHNIWFGPKNEVKVVSGYDWLKANARKAGKETENGGATVVTHIPSCSFFSDSGEKGSDVFFADVPWPSDVEVIGFDFKEIDPADPYGDVDFFMDQMGDIVDALTSGAFGIAEYIVGKVLDAIFSGGGGYHAYVAGEPGGYKWDERPHVIGIGWETSCSLGGKPIVYVVSFTIAGTKEVLARY